MKRTSHLALALLALLAPAVAASCGDSADGSSSSGGGGGPQPMCGDAIADPDLDEECDDGNLDETDDCLSDCTIARCGDGRLRAGYEDCDDGNTDDGDGCLSTCVAPTCGDGIVQSGEACDDGNEEDGDACSAACTAGAGCGNGATDGEEECDDGNQSNADACTNECLDARCGDGKAQLGTEECDDGNDVDDDSCTNACTTVAPTTTICPGTSVSLTAATDQTVGGDTSTSTNSYDCTCATADGPDVVYAITPASSGQLELELLSVNDDLDGVLYVRRGSCEGDDEVGCADDAFTGGAETLSLTVSGGTTYYAFVDGWGASAGEYLLSASLSTEIPGDDCPGLPVSLGSGATESLDGDTSAAEANRSGSGLCDSPNTREVVYAVTTAEAGTLTATVVPDAGFDVSVYIRSSCSGLATQLVCAEAGAEGDLEEAAAPVTAGGTYYVFVDGWDGDAGPFLIDLAHTP